MKIPGGSPAVKTRKYSTDVEQTLPEHVGNNPMSQIEIVKANVQQTIWPMCLTCTHTYCRCPVFRGFRWARTAAQRNHEKTLRTLTSSVCKRKMFFASDQRPFHFLLTAFAQDSPRIRNAAPFGLRLNSNQGTRRPEQDHAEF